MALLSGSGCWPLTSTVFAFPLCTGDSLGGLMLYVIYKALDELPNAVLSCRPADSYNRWVSYSCCSICLETKSPAIRASPESKWEFTWGTLFRAFRFCGCYCWTLAIEPLGALKIRGASSYLILVGAGRFMGKTSGVFLRRRTRYAPVATTTTRTRLPSTAVVITKRFL